MYIMHRIPGFKNYCIVKNKNIVYSIKRKKFMKIEYDRNGYLYVSLRRKGKSKQMYIHVIQWITFKKTDRKGFDIDHIDSDKSNNKLSNLQLLTRSENISKAHKDGIHKYGENSYNAKFTDEEVDMVCRLLSKNKKPREIVKILNIDKDNKKRYYKLVNSIQCGSWSHISNMYDFTNYNKRKVLNENVVQDICLQIELGKTNIEISRLFNVRQDTVSNIRRHKQWNNISEKYNF